MVGSGFHLIVSAGENANFPGRCYMSHRFLTMYENMNNFPERSFQIYICPLYLIDEWSVLRGGIVPNDNPQHPNLLKEKFQYHSCPVILSIWPSELCTLPMMQDLQAPVSLNSTCYTPPPRVECVLSRRYHGNSRNLLHPLLQYYIWAMDGRWMVVFLEMHNSAAVWIINTGDIFTAPLTLRSRITI